MVCYYTSYQDVEGSSSCKSCPTNARKLVGNVYNPGYISINDCVCDPFFG